VAPAVPSVPPTSPIPDANPRLAIRTVIPKELGLTEEEGDKFIQLLIDRGSQADFVALVGAAKYARYQELQRSTARQVRVRKMRTLLVNTDHQLTDEQAAQLDSLLYAEQRRRAADDNGRVRPS